MEAASSIKTCQMRTGERIASRLKAAARGGIGESKANDRIALTLLLGEELGERAPWTVVGEQLALLTGGGVGCWKRRGRRWKVEREKGGVESGEATGMVVESNRVESLWGREVVCGSDAVESRREAPRG